MSIHAPTWTLKGPFTIESSEATNTHTHTHQRMKVTPRVAASVRVCGRTSDRTRSLLPSRAHSWRTPGRRKAGGYAAVTRRASDRRREVYPKTRTRGEGIPVHMTYHQYPQYLAILLIHHYLESLGFQQ